MSLLRRVTDNYLFAIVAYLAVFLSTRVSSIVIARHLGEEQAGIFQFHHGNAMLLLFLVSAPFTLTNVRYGSRAEAEDRRQEAFALLRLSLLVVGGVASAVMAVTLTIPEQVAALFASPDVYAPTLPAIAVCLLPLVLNYQFVAAVQGRQDWRYVSLVNVVSLGGWTLVNVALWRLDAGLEAFLLAFAGQAYLATMMYVLYFRGELFRRLPWPTGEALRGYLGFGLAMVPLALAELVLWQRSAENLILERSVTAAAVGFYAYGYNTAQALMNAVPGIFWQVLFPVYAAQGALQNPEKRQRLFSVSSKMLALMAIPIGSVAMGLARPMVVFLFGAGFQAAAEVFSLSILGTMLFSMKMGLSAFLVSTSPPRPVAVLNLVAAVVMVGVFLVTIPAYGIIGAAMAKTVVQALVALAELRLLTRFTGSRYPLGEVVRLFAAGCLAAGLLRGYVAVTLTDLSTATAGLVTLGGLLLAPVALVFALALFRVLTASDVDIFERIAARLPGLPRRVVVAALRRMPLGGGSV